MKFPELLGFDEELPHLENVSKVTTEKIENVIGEITESSNELEYVLDKTNGLQSSDDKFVEKMSGFAIQCKDQLKTLVALKNELDNSYMLLAEYFSFDVNQYKMEELFSDIISFKRSFAKAYGENSRIHIMKYKANFSKSGKYKSAYPATTKTIQKLCRREFSLKIKNLSKEGLCFLFSSFSFWPLNNFQKIFFFKFPRNTGFP